MNFPNFNPDQTNQVLDKLFTKAQPNRENIVKESYKNRDRSFEKMLEKKSQSNSLSRNEELSRLEKKHDLKSLTNLADKEIKEAKLKAEEEAKQAQELASTIKELLTILEKLIHNQELSRSEQSFLVKNQDLLTQVGTKLGVFNPDKSQAFFKQLVGELKNLTPADNPKTFSKELLGQLENFALKLKNELSHLQQNPNLAKANLKNTFQAESIEGFSNPKSNLTFNQTQNENTAEAIKNTSLSRLENLSDLSGLKETNQLRSLKLEDFYIKSNKEFSVIKGSIKPPENTNPTHQNLNANVTPAMGSIAGNESNQIGMNGTGGANGISGTNTGTLNSIGAQLQRNTVVRFGSSEGNVSTQSGMMIREGFANSPAGIGNRMFAGQTTSQGINLRPFIEHLTGQIHRGFVAGQQVMLVKLQPENLGAIGILLRKESDNALHLKLNVDSIEVKDLIEKFGADIKTGLGKENLDLLSFDVNVNESGANSAGQKSADDNGFGEKRFNEILANEKNQISVTEKTQTVDLRLNQGVLNIKI